VGRREQSPLLSETAVAQAPPPEEVDAFLRRMANERPANVYFPPAADGKPEKGEFYPGERSRASACRILHERHRGKHPHSLVMEQSRRVCFQPYPARLTSLYHGGIGSRAMSILHMEYMRHDTLLQQDELRNGSDFSRKASLPSMSKDRVNMGVIRRCLRGLRVFSKDYWKEELVRYCTDLESFFERVFEANEDLISDWKLVLNVLDSLIQDLFTEILCRSDTASPQEVDALSRQQLTSSNETVRGLWDRMTARRSSGGRNQQTSARPQAGASNQGVKRSRSLKELLLNVPMVDGKRVCVKFLMGTCKGEEGKACPNKGDLIHSKVEVDPSTLEALKTVFSLRKRSHNKSE
jgi:hypothetical protein